MSEPSWKPGGQEARKPGNSLIYHTGVSVSIPKDLQQVEDGSRVRNAKYPAFSSNSARTATRQVLLSPVKSHFSTPSYTSWLQTMNSKHTSFGFLLVSHHCIIKDKPHFVYTWVPFYLSDPQVQNYIFNKKTLTF